jgi:hypothetical protein
LRAGGPARVVFADIKLSGQASLDLKVSSRGFDPLFLRVCVFDQRSGLQIGENATQVSRTAPGEVSIYLYKLFGPTVVVIEFSGPEKMEVQFESLTIS